ncbi:MAG: hypothetical protein N2C12_09930, partial [Planctomycetales bacterium]
VEEAGIERRRIAAVLKRQLVKLEGEKHSKAAIEEKMGRYEQEKRAQIKLQRPFLSANDRSRWCTIRALVDEGTYAITNIIEDQEDGRWRTIDMVKHERWGTPNLYSSKPTLLPTTLAGVYWIVKMSTGWTLADQPFQVVRTMLLLINIPAMVLLLVLLARLLERFGKTDWGRLLVMATATFGTFLTTFAVTLNNHLIAAALAMVAV